jgi:hypothetical protein
MKVPVVSLIKAANSMGSVGTLDDVEHLKINEIQQPMKGYSQKK